MPYISPGDAFSSSIEESLLQHEAIKRQHLEDALKIKHDERLAQAELDRVVDRRKHEADYEADRKQTHLDLRTTEAEKIQEADDKRFNQRMENTVLGDVYDAELIEGIRKRGGDPRAADPKQGLSTFSQALPEGAAKQAVGQQMRGPVRIIGTPAQQITSQMGTMQPGSSEWLQKALQLETTPGGHPPSAATLKLIEGASSPKTVETMTREQALARGRIPLDAKVLEPLQPKDTSAKEASLLAHAYDKSQGDFKTLEDKHRSSLDEYDKLGVMIRQNTNMADAVGSIENLRALVGGQGVRVNYPELKLEMQDTRGKWDSIGLSMNKWRTDLAQNPNTPLVLTPEQKSEITRLARALRKLTWNKYQKIQRARSAVDDAYDRESVRDMHKIGTQLHSEIEDDPASEPNAETVPIVGDTFRGGKVLKVTPVK